MERLKLKYEDTLRALSTLEDISKEPFSVIVRDAAIQRFEYTFESLWKFLKEYLKEKEGLIANSPKTCFREIFSLGFLNEEETAQCLDMTDRRNDTSHTYKEAIAQIIYGKIKEYVLLMRSIMERLGDKLEKK